ncbi:MAG: hypothetical protein H6767_09555 [Candidatus Peribacteria bacterium]|nr:MAG: hypothetical protein H6767_09555 [Candidatus Peribacteria bacterium]
MQRLFIVFFIILSIIATAVVINTQVNKTKETKKEKVLIHTGTTTVEEVQETPKTEKELSEEAVRKKIETLRKRFAVKGLIVSGDIHLKNDEYVHALKKYLEAYNKNKNDPVILNKI